MDSDKGCTAFIKRNADIMLYLLYPARWNHLTTAPAFVEIKQDRVVAIIHGLAEKQEFTNPEFDEFVRQDVKECIGKLVQIRNYYKKGGL